LQQSDVVMHVSPIALHIVLPISTHIPPPACALSQ
jgi:hypothetical protein